MSADLDTLHRWKRPVVRPRVRSGPINRMLILTGGMGWLAWAIWPANGDLLLQLIAAWCAALYALAAGMLALSRLLKDYGLRRDLAIGQVLTIDYGTARQSTAKERAARGMSVSNHGELLGFDDNGRAVWRPMQGPFGLIEMPPGVGKTVNLVVGSILHRAKLGNSVVVPDVKTELAVMLAPALRAMGFEVWCVNPAGRHAELTGETVLNPYQPLIDAVYDEGDARKNAVKIASDYAALHYPSTRDEKNPYFVFGSRRAMVLGMLSNALIDPAGCTPTALYMLITDPEAFLARCEMIVSSLETATPDDPIVAMLKGEARNFLHRAEKNEENFAAFLEGAGQRLLAFNPAGHLGYYGRGAIHNLSSLRERQVILFIMTPLSHMREFSDFTSLLNHNIIGACKATPDGYPIHIVGEEALNYRFHDLVSDLETMRQFGVTADFYIQSFAGLERHYGKEAAAAIESYADIRIYAGLNSYARAKHVSDMLSETTIRKQEVSYGAAAKELSLSSREIGRPLMKPDEVLAMEKDSAWLFVRGLHPVRLRLVNYAQVSPWSDWVAASPITGTRLHGKPLLTVNYPGGRHD
jgi:type IV secretory pathway TraG/TraD family ATPase VirD4